MTSAQQPMGSHTGRPWCWINSNGGDTHEWMQFAFFYGPLMLVFLFNLMIYFMLCRKVGSFMSPLQHKIRRRLFFYLGAFIFLSGWGLANRLWQSFDGEPLYFLSCADALCGPLQGFCNALVYGMNRRLRVRYWRMCCSGGGGAAGEPLSGAAGEADHLVPGRSQDGFLRMSSGERRGYYGFADPHAAQQHQSQSVHAVAGVVPELAAPKGEHAGDTWGDQSLRVAASGQSLMGGSLPSSLDAPTQLRHW